MRSLLLLLPLGLLLASCGSDSDLPPMVTGGGIDESRAEELYAEAQQAEQSGRTKKAAKLYEDLADDIPLSNRAAEARFRQAKLLEEMGETLDSFDAYQMLLERHQGSGYYQQALSSQSEMAFAAADGEIKNSFLGLKSKLSPDKVAGMLEKVADNAPRSRLAARAEFKIGQTYANQGGMSASAKALAAYRGVVENYPDYPEAPEAQFAIGELLLKDAREGNQDQANLNRAEEAFRDYLGQFPGHKRNAEARKLLASIDSRDVQNTYDIAVFYENKGQLDSARYYYQEVVRKTAYGDLHEKAKARLAKLGN